MQPRLAIDEASIWNELPKPEGWRQDYGQNLVLAALIILSGATSGCVTSDTLIKLNPDGSGVVVQKTLMSTEMIAQLTTMMQGFAQQMAAQERGPEGSENA